LPDGSPLDYEPENELGVIYLFSALARSRFGLHIERVRAGYPDCIGYRHGKRIRIEFEYKSKNFRIHKHDPRKCDWLVCWIHDWPGAPEKIRIVELRKEYNLGFNVWLQPVSGEYRETLSRLRHSERWSVPSQAMQGDLLLFYRTSPDKYVQDVFRVAGPVKHIIASWKPGKDYMAPIRRVATLRAPMHYSELQQHPVLKTAGFVRGQMRGRFKVSDYWPEIYHMIISRNPALTKILKPFGPHKID
jgi:hypothetical protein